jgi:hypothetical protein
MTIQPKPTKNQQIKMKQTFKTFLINEVKYENGIDVEIDNHGRISGTVSPSSSGKKELRSEFTAADEMNKHVSPDKKPGVMTLSAAERARADARKKIKKQSIWRKVVDKITGRGD